MKKLKKSIIDNRNSHNPEEEKRDVEIKKYKEILDVMNDNLKMELGNYDEDIKEGVKKIIEFCCSVEQFKGN